MKRKSKIVYNVIFLGIIIIGLLSIIYCFSEKKEGWHSDEVWSYGFANSYYQKDVFRDENGKNINIDKWVDSDILRSYMEVDDGERFKFGSVYNNQIEDLSPPLHSMILHAICSMFPNTFSWWYSFSINIVAYIITMIYLYKLCVKLKDEKLGLICCVMYGFSLAARDTYIYLRMYAMCTALTIVYLYNVVSWIKTEKTKKILSKNIIGIFLTTLLMFWTHYYLISLVGIITLCLCLGFLFSKRIKIMFKYGVMQSVSLILSFLAFPSVINMFVSHQDNVNKMVDSVSAHISFSVKMRILLNFILYKLYGIKISAYRDYLWVKVIILSLIGIVIILLPLIFLLRNTDFILNLKTKIRNLYVTLLKIWKRIDKIYVIMGVAVAGQMAVIVQTSQVYEMGQSESRYLMYLYPMVSIIVCVIIYDIVRKIKKERPAHFLLSIILIMSLCVSFITRRKDTNFYFQQSIKGQSIDQVVDGKDCIFVCSENYGIVYMMPLLTNSNMYFQTFVGDYNLYTNEYKNVKKDDVVLIIDVTRYEASKGLAKIAENGEEVLNNIRKEYDDIIEYYKELYGADTAEKISTQVVFSRNMETYVFK